MTTEASNIHYFEYDCYNEQRRTANDSITYPKNNETELSAEEDIPKCETHEPNSLLDENYQNRSLKTLNCCAEHQHDIFYKGCKW